MLLLAILPAAAMAIPSTETVLSTLAPEQGAEVAAYEVNIDSARLERLKKLNPIARFRHKNGLTTVNPSTGMIDSTLYIRSQHKRHIERVNRNDLRATFVPKGQWMVGGTINFNEWDTDNNNFLVLKNMNLQGHTFSGSPYIGYFVAKNLAVGGRYSYNRNYFYLGQFDLNLGEDFNISLSDLYYLGHKHQGSAFMRSYMPIGKSKIFGVFTELDATYSQTTSKNSTGTGQDYDGTYGVTHAVQLGFMPGLAVFMTDFVAAECSIGVMGLNYKWGDTRTNRVESGYSRGGGANFQFNLFSVNIGITFYL